jgi:Mor family transcriptional regulator
MPTHIALLYPTRSPEKPKRKDESARDSRNEEIRRRYNAGERVVDMAKEYGMTIQGIYRILRGD